MARPASGKDVLEKAKETLANARTIEDLRQAQAVILPLEYGFSIDQVAAALGISKGWACQLRRRFIKAGGLPAESKPKRGGRHRENMSKEEEAAFLAPFFDKPIHGGILSIPGKVCRVFRAKVYHLFRGKVCHLFQARFVVRT